MDRDETRAVLNFLLSAYPKTMVRDREQTIAIWLETFGTCEKDQVMKAAKKYIAGHRYFPTVFDIKDLMARLSPEGRISEAEKIARANDRLPDFEHSGCVQIPCPYLREGQTTFCRRCIFDGGLTK